MRWSLSGRSNHFSSNGDLPSRSSSASWIGEHAGPRPRRVVQLRRLERLAELRVPVGIAGPVEGQHRDVVDLAGGRGAGSPLVVAVGDETCGRVRRMIADQPAGGLVDVGLVERVGVLVGRRVGHARVAVAEHDDLVEADDPGRLGQLGRPHRDDLGLLLLRREAVERLAGLAQRRVLQVALLAAGAAHQHGVHALGVVAGDGRRALGRLVVGVGVDGEQRQSLGAGGSHPTRRYPRRVAASRVRYAPAVSPRLARRAPSLAAVPAVVARGVRHRRRPRPAASRRASSGRR